MTTPQIRNALEEDAIAVTEIYNQGIAARSSTFETAPRDVDDIRARLRDTEFPTLVAVDAGALARLRAAGRVPDPYASCCGSLNSDVSVFARRPAAAPSTMR